MISKNQLNYKLNNPFLFKFLEYDEFKNNFFNNKSYYLKEKNEFLHSNHRKLFIDKINDNLLEINIDEKKKLYLNEILTLKKIDDLFLCWIYYCNFFIPILNQQKKILQNKNAKFYKKNSMDNEERYFKYNTSFLSEEKKPFLNFLNNNLGVFDFLMFKQAVNLYDYSYDLILGTHKIMLDISTDTIVIDSLEKYARNEVRVRSYSNVLKKEHKNEEIRIILRKILKQILISSSEKKIVDDFFLNKIKKINYRRENLLEFLKKNDNYELYYNYINNLIYILGKKIKLLFLIRQLYFIKNFSQNFKYLILCRKKLLFLLKKEKSCRKKLLFFKTRKNRMKIKNLNNNEDFYFYKRRSNFYNFYTLMERDKKEKYKNFFFSSLSEFSIFIDVDGSKYFNSYLKHSFRNNNEEEIDVNDFFKTTNYNLNYMNYTESMEVEVLKNYVKKNKYIKEFLKGLNNYKFTTYRYAHPYLMDGDVLEVEGFLKKILKENRKVKFNYNIIMEKYKIFFDSHQNEKKKEQNWNNKTKIVFDLNEYVFTNLSKNKNNYITFTNKDFSIDNNLSLFLEFFIFGHIMFNLIGLNQKFNYYFCFNFLSKNYLNKNEYYSVLKNNTISSKYIKNKRVFKTQYLLSFRDKIWFYLPTINKFYYSYCVSFFRFLFSSVIVSFFSKQNFIFYIICKLYLYIIDTTIMQVFLLTPPGLIRYYVEKFFEKIFKIINFPYSYSDFVRFSYKIQYYIKVPGFSLSDINNIISYYIASPYIYFYEKFFSLLITNIFFIVDLILKVL